MPQRLFQHLEIISPPLNLEQLISARVCRIAERRLIFRGLLALGSLGGVVWSVILVGARIAETGFYYYVSLLVSDNGLALVYWRELILTLTESMPLLLITVGLVFLACLFWLTPQLAEDAQFVTL